MHTYAHLFYISTLERFDLVATSPTRIWEEFGSNLGQNIWIRAFSLSLDTWRYNSPIKPPQIPSSSPLINHHTVRIPDNSAIKDSTKTYLKTTGLDRRMSGLPKDNWIRIWKEKSRPNLSNIRNLMEVRKALDSVVGWGTSWKIAGSILDEVIEFHSICLILPAALSSWGWLNF
jgi:hypothetical protein